MSSSTRVSALPYLDFAAKLTDVSQAPRWRVLPLVSALSVALASTVISGESHAQLRGAWFTQSNAAQQHQNANNNHAIRAAQQAANMQQQQAAARAQLSHSLDNLNRTASAIAAQQAAQNAARLAAQQQASNVAEGLTQGGLEVAVGDKAQWLGAEAPVHTQQNGQHHVGIKQTESKAILNWNRFDVGRNTTVEFQQKNTDAVLNRVVGDQVTPSQIQGKIKGDGTVMVVNQNGIVFSGTSQVNVRNLVAAAAKITDTQFINNGLYSKDGLASFTNADGKIQVHSGAQIRTHEPTSVTQGGGYVLLVGDELNNAGLITTPKGQTQLAAGDNFIIRKGVGTDANTASTTRGNEIAPQLDTDSKAGKVSNTGLIVSREGDITLAGRDVQQNGVAVSTTTVSQRGTVHLLNSISDKGGQITLGQNAITTVLIDTDGNTTALDSQRDALIKESIEQDVLRSQSAAGAFNNLSVLADRRDQSRIEIVSGGNIVFEGDSLTLATGGQIVANAAKRSFVADGARLDVAGAVGVNVAMESNNVKVNVQGFELRDAPLNRDSGKLFNNDVWIDRRQLVLVPKGTGGYESDRWYTANGLLEVGGYLSNQGHSIGEWAAQGGTVLLGGSEVITQAGSKVNIAGGTLDVQSGYINQTWLKGEDGRIYHLNSAPAYMLHHSIYHGYQSLHSRWGEKATRVFYSPLLAPQQRYEMGYTVGRDAGQLIISAPTVILEGDIQATVFNGARQTKTPGPIDDGYRQIQLAVARSARLSVPGQNLLGEWKATYDTDVRLGEFETISHELGFDHDLHAERKDTLWLDAQTVSSWGLGGLRIDTHGTIHIEKPLSFAAGATVELSSYGKLEVKSSLQTRGGSIRLSAGGLSAIPGDTALASSDLRVHDGVLIDTRGLWVNLQQSPDETAALAWLDGGKVLLQAYGDLTIEPGSVLDVSSGGGLRTDGSLQSALGGDISLKINDKFGETSGVLTLDGDIRGYGVSGGGTLHLATGESWTIDGSVLVNEGVLGQGEMALINLVLAQDLEVKAGQVAPIDMSMVLARKYYAAGETFEFDAVWPQLGTYVSIYVGKDWVLPRSISYVTTADGSYRWAGNPIPAGQTITMLANNAKLPKGFYVDPEVFPQGFDLGTTLTHTLSVKGGAVATDTIRVAAGTLVPAGTTPGQAIAVHTPTRLHQVQDWLQSGFSRYELNARNGLAVVGSARLAPVVPTWHVSSRTMAAPSGSAPADVFDLALDPLFFEDAKGGHLRSRPGASLSLETGLQGSLLIGEDASLMVDPQRDIRLAGHGKMITVHGHLSAPAGTIEVLHYNSYGADGANSRVVWVGSTALLDVAGRAYTFTDAQQHRYGVVLDGGNVILGSRSGPKNDKGITPSTGAYIVLQPGARIDASGTSVVLDTKKQKWHLSVAPQATPQLIASHGGKIALRSYSGIYNEASLMARAGGDQASGGTLIMELESHVYNTYQGSNPLFSPNSLNGRVLTLSQEKPANVLPSEISTALSQADSILPFGRAHVSAQEILEGGFDSVRLLGREAIEFNGPITLSLGRSLTLAQGALFSSTPEASVTLSAPHILLDGHTSMSVELSEQAPSHLPDYDPGSHLIIQGGLIEIRERVGGKFNAMTLASTGDIRFLPSASTTLLANSGDLTLSAAVVYPASHVRAAVYAGATLGLLDGSLTQGEPATLAIKQAPGSRAHMPYSVFGDLSLYANRMEQGGSLWAPMGAISLGILDERPEESPDWIELQTGSLTSVSALGLRMIYGGTSDGQNYTVDGRRPGAVQIITGQVTGGLGGAKDLGIHMQAYGIHSAAGSVIDVSGGGELLGAAFVSGRGGSVDALVHPRERGKQVYAVLPGVSTAPTAGGYYTEWKGDLPELGQQIRIPAGVPGLPEGEYSLLPAHYALLPGAFRVELGARSYALPAGVYPMPGGGSYRLNAITGVQGTPIQDAGTVTATLTAGRDVRRWSQYNETSYSDYQLARADMLSTTRSQLERDARSLYLRLRSGPSMTAETLALPALSFEGSTRFNAANGGYDGAVILAGEEYQSEASLVITGPGSTTERNANGLVAVSAEALNAIAAPAMYIGGRQWVEANNPTVIKASGGGMLALEPGAVLRAAQVMLLSSYYDGALRLASDSGISTLGHQAILPDSSMGYLFSINGIAASNARLDLTPYPNSTNTITLDDQAQLYAEGSLGFGAGSGIHTQGRPRIGARYLSLAGSSINIGADAPTLEAASQAGTLPAGLSFDRDFFDVLLQGDVSSGAPAAQVLTLTTTGSLNFLGSVALSSYHAVTGASLLDELVLNTPAIYGYGGPQALASIDTEHLIWGGSYQASDDNYSVEYLEFVPPGAVLPNGPGTGQGRLLIRAERIQLGLSQRSQPASQVALHRLLLGFSHVSLSARQHIINQHSGSLAAFQTPDDRHLTNNDFTYDPALYQGQGGNLELLTPLLTGEAGSNMSYYAGAGLSLRQANDRTTSTFEALTGLGATLTMRADRIDINSAIALPSGRLTLTTDKDIYLHPEAYIDLAGRVTDFYDLRRYSWGGDFSAESKQGNIIMSQGAWLNASAASVPFNQNDHNTLTHHGDAGQLQFSATAKEQGVVRLEGMLLAQGQEGHQGGRLEIQAQRLGTSEATTSADFAALNERLDVNGFEGGRRFVLKQGNLHIQQALRTRQLEVSVDGGSLIVSGHLNASGTAPGLLRLAARDDLTLTSSARLDVHGTQLQVDAYGKPIWALNRGQIELTSLQGWLRLQPQASINMSSPDGQARGNLILNTGRSDANGQAHEVAGDARIEAAGPLQLAGAYRIALNAFWSYSPTDEVGSVVQDNGSLTPVSADGRLGLDQIHERSTAFMAAALANSQLTARTVGLQDYGPAYHLRPGIDISSAATDHGQLRVEGNLDLSVYRYGPNKAEPLALVLRAQDALNVRGSISDGFMAAPAVDPIYGTIADIGNDVGGNFVKNWSWLILAEGKTVTLMQDWTLPQYWWLPKLPMDSSGRQYQPGEKIAKGTQLTRFQVSTYDTSQVPPHLFWGIADPGKPAYSAASPFAPLQQPGSESASIRLISGAELASADRRARQSPTQLEGGGRLLLENPVANPNNADWQLPSVIRTGTGELELLAGGDFTQLTLFGIYTAGSGVTAPSHIVLPTGTNLSEGGGDLYVATQGQLRAYLYDQLTEKYNTYGVDNWLWRSGNHLSGEKATWSINTGQQVAGRWLGFAGMGTLGGGNLNLDVKGDAGVINPAPGENRNKGIHTSHGLVLAVGASGYVKSVQHNSQGQVVGGELQQYGGGDMRVRVGGRLNPAAIGPDGGFSVYGRGDLDGSFTSVRGSLDVQAAALGGIKRVYGRNPANDQRGIDPYRVSMAVAAGGPVLVLGDSPARLRSREDLVLGGVGDAGQINTKAGVSWFSLWTDRTEIALYAAGGHMAPLDTSTRTVNEKWDYNSDFDYAALPARFEAVAASGSLYYGASSYKHQESFKPRLLLAPAARSGLTLAAADSIQGAGLYFDMSMSQASDALYLDLSGARFDVDSLPGPLKPVFGQPDRDQLRNFLYFQGSPEISTTSPETSEPLRIYALKGDVSNVLIGERLTSKMQQYKPVTWHVGSAQPLRLYAGRDILNFGSGTLHNGFNPSLIIHRDLTDVSVLQAGRDILYANLEVGGPGLLELIAGRHVYQGNDARLTSRGPLLEGDLRSGADITILAGAGPQGPDWAALTALYLDPSRQADTGHGMSLAGQPSKVAHTYQIELAKWLAERFDYEALDVKDALAFFHALAPEQQRIFLRQVYFAELKEGGREYNDTSSPRAGSYLRGRQAIAALFPSYHIPHSIDEHGVWQTSSLVEQIQSGVALQSHLGGDPLNLVDQNGLPYAQRYTVLNRRGDVILFQGDKQAKQNNAGLRTVNGGTVQVMAPAGQIVIGLESIQPNDAPEMSPAGIITQGLGDIQLYSKGSVLLGLSRIMTTFGGSIQAWSMVGDINAGRGSKTGQVYTPPKRLYDDLGNITISPQVPSTGAGIATLAPIPEVPAGDVDLIAPLGTIDAGEAGIRVSGNVNLAALHVVNAENIQVQGESKGIPIAVTVNVGALTSASSAATSAATAAQETLARTRDAARSNQPSQIQVQVLGFGAGGQSSQAPASEPASVRAAALTESADYDRQGAVRVLSFGPLSAAILGYLEPAEREQLLP